MGDLLCCICGDEIRRGWFCNKCYKLHRESIDNYVEWVAYCENDEKKRRRDKFKYCIFLGDNYDIIDYGDADHHIYKLVLRDGYGWQT